MKLGVDVLGSRFALSFDESVSADLRREITQQWQHLSADTSGPVSGAYRVTVGATLGAIPASTKLVPARDEQHAPDLLATILTLAGLRKLAGTTYLLHAAGLATEDGRVIALVGPSGRGKTTASRELGKSMGYVSDETVAIRPDLSVIPYPKPLSIGQRPGIKRMHSPESLGLHPASGPLRLGALALLDRSTKPITPRVEEVELIEGIGELVEQSSALAQLPHPLRWLADMVTASGGIRRIVFSDVKDLRSLVDAVLDSSPMAVPETAIVDLPPVTPTRVDSLGRAEVVDSLMIDGRLAILTGKRLHLLDGIGPEVWRLAEDVTVTQLAVQLQKEIGDPPSSVDLMDTVSAAVTNMVDANLLQYGHD